MRMAGTNTQTVQGVGTVALGDLKLVKLEYEQWEQRAIQRDKNMRLAMTESAMCRILGL